MRNTIVIAIICLVAFAGCGKDKFTTKPQLKFKKVNGNVFGKLQPMEFTISFTDAEGDFNPGKVFIQRVNPECTADTGFIDSLPLPEFPSSSSFEGDILLQYSLGGTNGGGVRPMTEPPGECSDTSACYFRFSVRDKAGNQSDTVNSGTIILIKN